MRLLYPGLGNTFAAPIIYVVGGMLGHTSRLNLVFVFTALGSVFLAAYLATRLFGESSRALSISLKIERWVFRLVLFCALLAFAKLVLRLLLRSVAD